jgi:hypothetical protein
LEGNKAARALILYDWTGSIDQKAWIDIALNFFDMVGAKSNSATYMRAGKSNKISNSSRLYKSLENGFFDTCSIQRLLPPFDDMINFDTHSEFTIWSDRARKTIFSYEASDLDVSLFVGLIQDLNSIFGITYGHSISYPTVTGAAMYASGLNHQSLDGGSESFDQRHIWKLERLDMVLQKRLAPFRHLEGMLRDVYQFNVLTSVHLRRPLGNMVLRDWISASGHRGLLEEVVSGVWVWIVQEAELDTVRSELQEAGILITRPPR